jgi:starch synthase
MKILFLSAEVAPFAKTGGLGDVAGALPKALQAMGHDVRVVMPAYATIERGYKGVTAWDRGMIVPMGSEGLNAGIYESTLPDSEVPIYFVAERNLFDRPEIYGYNDDPYRFAFFSRAALQIAEELQWRPDVVHAHDWHAAPAIFWLATAGNNFNFYRNIPTVFTIHNLAHQGMTSNDILRYMGIWVGNHLREESPGMINLMARGIYHASIINTVSPTYAKEITTQDGGARLEGLLQHRSWDLHGILNGIDTDVWNPATDSRLAANYDATTLAEKVKNKRALQAYTGLPQRDDVPLLAIVTRLDYQKGIDILGEALYPLLQGQAGEAQFVVLGTGAKEYEDMFASYARRYPHKVGAILEYSAGLAPLIYAGSDMFLMPSRFEPCGLGQLIAMRYGSIPVVRATGGLADTVQHGETGVTFYHLSGNALWNAMKNALFVYNTNKAHWQHMQLAGMVQDFSWERSAKSYVQLYEWARAK